MLRGLEEHAAVLAELGASTEVSPAERAVGAVVRGERPAGGLPVELGRDAREALMTAAIIDGRLDLVVELVGPDFVAPAGGGPSGTLLHQVATQEIPVLRAEHDPRDRRVEVRARAGDRVGAELEQAPCSIRVPDRRRRGAPARARSRARAPFRRGCGGAARRLARRPGLESTA